MSNRKCMNSRLCLSSTIFACLIHCTLNSLHCMSNSFCRIVLCVGRHLSAHRSGAEWSVRGMLSRLSRFRVVLRYLSVRVPSLSIAGSLRVDASSSDGSRKKKLLMSELQARSRHTRGTAGSLGMDRARFGGVLCQKRASLSSQQLAMHAPPTAVS